MNKFAPLLLSIACLFSSCNLATPQNYFDRAVLNCNLMHGFAGRGMQQELESPSDKLADAKTGATVSMKRKEIIDEKVQSLETNLAKIKQLKETDDTREVLQASLALYNYVLPIYKTEYQELAKLYDEGAAPEKIEAMEQSLGAKYFVGFETLFDKLTAVAKPFAARHDIKVKWDVSTSPSF